MHRLNIIINVINFQNFISDKRQSIIPPFYFFLEHAEAKLLACIYSDLPDINKQGPLGESHWIIKSAD